LDLSWDRQARVLGHGYRARAKSFRRLNHALQAVWLSQIVKADFNTDILSLRRGAPKDFNREYLQIFTQDVLKPLHSLITRRTTWIKEFADFNQKLLVDKWDRRFETDY